MTVLECFRLGDYLLSPFQSNGSLEEAVPSGGTVPEEDTARDRNAWPSPGLQAALPGTDRSLFTVTELEPRAFYPQS